MLAVMQPSAATGCQQGDDIIPINHSWHLMVLQEAADGDVATPPAPPPQWLLLLTC
jgi:hypothetical protein